MNEDSMKFLLAMLPQNSLFMFISVQMFFRGLNLLIDFLSVFFRAQSDMAEHGTNDTALDKSICKMYKSKIFWYFQCSEVNLKQLFTQKWTIVDVYSLFCGTQTKKC